MLNVTCVHAPVFEHTFITVASVAPAVLRTCIWIWSYVIVSVQCGWYQKLSVGLPPGTVTVCVSVLLPFTAVVEPVRAEYAPVCGVVLITGRNAPLVDHELRLPVSKPGFRTTFAGGTTDASATSSSRK